MKALLPVICGPTASGKTDIAVSLCELLGGEVISADSMQIYRGMDVLSAIPSVEERRGIPHHMLACVEPDEKYSADRYREAANARIADCRARGRQPVLCGGTGLYINAVTRPMNFSDESDDALHRELIDSAQTQEGRHALFERLRAVDPDSANRLHENDIRRVARAIEIYTLTGLTMTEQMRRDSLREGDYDERLFAPDWPRETLYSRIDARVDRMLQNGMIDEVRTLMAQQERHPTAVQAIGYKEIAEALRGERAMEDAVAQVKRASRNLAKRQLTWFKHDPRVVWIPAEGRSASDIASEIADRLSAC